MSRSRQVVKIGSSLLVDPKAGLRREWLRSLASDLAACSGRGLESIVVTSGAIALGRLSLRLRARQLRLEEKQAAAAVGQIALAHAYQASLAECGLATAQVLLTLEDTESRRRYLNARSTVEALLRLGVVPVVNENDTVATNEIRFGDNDRLSARVAVMASADELILLSDVDGLYTADPGRHPDAVRIERVDEITPEIEAMAGGAGSPAGTGGMVSKLAAARIATHAGCRVVIAPGVGPHPLERLAQGGACTRFAATANSRRARKEWIAGALAAMGVIRIDDGAVRALRRGSSLLPAGITRIEGAFERGDAVLVRGPDGKDLAKGLSAYDVADAQRIVGRRTEEIEGILGYRGRDELIHRDDL
ncbi:MAG: glutamate 5-kinase, partial [Geminicoccaceae bacterium]